MAKVTRSTMLHPETAEALEVIRMIEGHRSVSSLIASIIEAHLKAQPVGREVLEQYRALAKQGERITPRRLLVEEDRGLIEYSISADAA